MQYISATVPLMDPISIECNTGVNYCMSIKYDDENDNSKSFNE